MNKWQALVQEFHKKFNINQNNNTPAIRDGELRCKLIKEETEETVYAIRTGNLVEAIDGLCDLMYVVLGAADTFGIDLEPFFLEVHRSNMTKEPGNTREDGKILKTDSWQPPRIKEILDGLKTARDVELIQSAIESLEAVRFTPEGSVTDWFETTQGENCARVVQALTALREALILKKT